MRTKVKYSEPLKKFISTAIILTETAMDTVSPKFVSEQLENQSLEINFRAATDKKARLVISFQNKTCPLPAMALDQILLLTHTRFRLV